jgi:hemerythrin-like domain-containing protein
MPVQIGARRDSGFDDPLGMLQDCHRRIEHFVKVLSTVAARARGRALDTEEFSAVDAALNYFRIGGVRHTADEEESLFPRLRGRSDAPQETVGSLHQEHEQADALHADLDRLFSAWMVSGSLVKDQQAELDAAMSQLDQLYSSHIELEERILFPAAAKLLSREELAVIGEEFRRRRP